MHPQLESIFDEAERRYLKPEELGMINQYVDSLPERLDAYKTLRDRELEIMQAVADQLVAALPQESPEQLERSIKNALLMLRYCAMGMLLNDEAFVEKRLLSWLPKMLNPQQTTVIDTALYRLLNQRLSQVLTQKQIGLLGPQIMKVETALLNQSPTPVAASR